MLNKFFKIINNKYSKFFKFIFFLRYLLAIFLISIALVLIIPNFFDYEKRAGIVKKSILKNYDLKISKIEKIQFKLFPLPNLELKNVLIDDENITKIFLVKNLKIFPKLISFYHYENFKINKIVLKDSVILSDISKIETLTKKLIYKKNKISIDQLNLEIFG